MAVTEYPAKFNELWAINAIGDKNSAFVKVNMLLNEHGTSVNDEPITYDFLIRKYGEYINYMQTLQRGEYTRSKDMIKCLWDFIDQEKYNESFAGPRKQRDNYLFGKFDFDYLERAVSEFKDLVKQWKSGARNG